MRVKHKLLHKHYEAREVGWELINQCLKLYFVVIKESRINMLLISSLANLF